MWRIPLTWLACFSGYMLLAGTFSTHELAVGAGLAMAVTGWSVVARRAAPARFRFAWAQGVPLARALLDLPGASGRTALALARAVLRPGVLGRADEVAFRPGAQEDPRERARRAVAVLAASLAPASFVVRVERERERALIHGVRAPAPKPDREWLA